jgi:hypothetical protein
MYTPVLKERTPVALGFEISSKISMRWLVKVVRLPFTLMLALG